jgi:PAS domain S-box-containing protein
MENSSPSNYLNDPVKNNSDSSSQLISDYEEQIQILKDQLSQLKKLAGQNSMPAHSFKTLIPDLIQQAIIVTDINGTVTYWNNHATTVYGWLREEVLGKNIMDFIATDLSYTEGMAIMEELKYGRSWSGEYMVKHKDEHTFKVYVHDSPLYDEAGNVTGIIGVSRDLREEIKTREFIRFQTNLLDNVEQAVIATDMEGKVFYWNHYAEKLYGWTKEEMMGKPVGVIQTNDPVYIQQGEQLMAAFKKGQSWSGEFLLQNKKGEQFYTYCVNSPIKNNEGELIGIIAVSNNITQQILAQKEKEFERLNQQALIDSTVDLIWSVNSKYELITGNNSFIQRLKEYTGTEIKPGELLFNKEIFPPDYLDFWKEKYDHGLTGERFTFEIQSPPIGNVPPRWSEVTVNPIFNTLNEVIGVACYGRDITDAKIAAQAMQKSEERFRVMFEKAPLGIALIDSYTGHIYDVNQKFAAIAGRTIEELRTVDWMTITHPEDVQEDLDNMQLLNEKKIPGFSMQKRYIKPDGSYVWIQMSIVPMEHKEGENPRHLCMIEDITQLKENISAIELSNERFNLVAKATNDAIWDWDLVTNKVIRLGTGLEKYFGYNSETASVDNDFWLRCVHPDDLPLVLASRQQVLDDPSKTNWSDEYWFLKANGQYAYVYDKGYIIRNHEGKAIRMIGATQDITEQKRADLMLKELNSKLEKRAFELEQSNAELERFAYVASHDLQEPLRMVSSFLQLFEKKYKNQIDETADKYIHFAVDGAERMKRLIQDLLKYSRAGRSQDELGSTDMNQVAAEVVTTFEPEIRERNATIKTGHLPVLPRTRKVQMVQLLQNIISNALKYNNSKNPLIQIDATETEDHWQITIKDNGIGFDEKYADKVFMIFQRLHHKEEFSGTGIGLAICKKIMELHGGQIRVESEPGKGSIFYLTFFKTKGSTTYEFTQTD